MSKASNLPQNDIQWCLLCNTALFIVISIARLSVPNRVCANKMSWMRNSNQQWLTIPDFIKQFGDRSSHALSFYSPTYTVEHLLAMNDRIDS